MLASSGGIPTVMAFILVAWVVLLVVVVVAGALTGRVTLRPCYSVVELSDDTHVSRDQPGTSAPDSG